MALDKTNKEKLIFLNTLYEEVVGLKHCYYSTSISDQKIKLICDYIIKILNDKNINKNTIFFVQNNLVYKLIKIFKYYNPDFVNFLNENHLYSLRKTNQFDRKKGCICVVCDQNTKEYKRLLSSNSARFLISLVSTYNYKLKLNPQDEGWVHYKDCIFTSRDYPWLASWGLAQSKKENSDEKRTSGLWRPTHKGVLFVQNKIKIPKYIYTYKGKVTKTDENELVSIIEILGKKFDYNQLITGIYK